MAGRIEHLRHEFVRFIPPELVDGVLYVSIEYKVAVHRCCSGCGEKVVTPLSPAGWEVSFDGASVSLSPSIAGGACNSHYFVRRSRVIWVRPLSSRQAAAAARRDLLAAQLLDDEAPAGTGETPAPPRWRRLLSRLGLGPHYGDAP